MKRKAVVYRLQIAVRLCVLFVSSSRTNQATHKEGHLPGATSRPKIHPRRRKGTERRREYGIRSAQVGLADGSSLTGRRLYSYLHCVLVRSRHRPFGHERFSSNALVLMGWFRNGIGGGRPRSWRPEERSGVGGRKGGGAKEWHKEKRRKKIPKKGDEERYRES